MSSIENIIFEFIVNGPDGNQYIYQYDNGDANSDGDNSDDYEELNYIDIGFNTKYVKLNTNYNDLIENFKKLQQDKFPNKIKKIIDITKNYKLYNFYCLDNKYETYNNILYDIKNYYICEITEENKNFFINYIDKKKN